MMELETLLKIIKKRIGLSLIQHPIFAPHIEGNEFWYGRKCFSAFYLAIIDENLDLAPGIVPEA